MLAKVLEQISLGNGLPGNGQVLHSLVQGLIQYLWIGPPELPHKALPMTSSESSWHVASSKLLQLVLGESASGKDIAMELLRKYISQAHDDSRAVLSPDTLKRECCGSWEAVGTDPLVRGAAGSVGAVWAGFEGWVYHFR